MANDIPGATDLRRAILALLRESPGPINVYALLDLLNRRTGKKRHANSIYRILDHLIEADLVLYVISWKRFMARPPASGPTPLLLLCEVCRQVDVIGDLRIGQGVARLAARARFGLRATHLEISGTCRECRGP